MACTARTCLPQGSDLLQVGQILAAQSAAERSGAAFDGRLAAAVAGADFSSILPPELTGGGGSDGRWAKTRRSSGGKHEGAARGSGSGKKKKKKGARDFACPCHLLHMLTCCVIAPQLSAALAQAANCRSLPAYLPPAPFTADKKSRRSKLKPVAFVSVGAINPDASVEVALPAAMAAAAAAAAATSGDGGSSGSDIEMAAAAAAAASSGSGSGSSDIDCAGPPPAAEDEWGDAQPQLTAVAAAGIQLLEVVEDLSGSEAEPLQQPAPATAAAAGIAARAAAAAAAAAAESEERDDADDEGEPVGLGSSGALYTRWACTACLPAHLRACPLTATAADCCCCCCCRRH